MWTVEALFKLDDQNEAGHVPESLQAGWVEQMKTERNYHYLRGTDEELWCEDTEHLGSGQRGSLGEA